MDNTEKECWFKSLRSKLSSLEWLAAIFVQSRVDKYCSLIEMTQHFSKFSQTFGRTLFLTKDKMTFG